MDRTNRLLSFLDHSPTPYHAIENIKKSLLANSFKELDEKSSSWSLSKGSSYYVTRNDSSMIAFSIPSQLDWSKAYCSIIATHVDSPCLKIKPRSSRFKDGGMLEVAVETYGGGLWHTWFDRDLSIAGKIVTRSKNGSINQRLVNLNKALLKIPTLAIHLDRSVKDGFNFNTEIHLQPILATDYFVNSLEEEERSNGTRKGYGKNMERERDESRHDSSHLSCLSKNKCVHNALLSKLTQSDDEVEGILSMDLSLYDHQKAAIGGLFDEFIFSARLDNLLLSFCAMEAINQCAFDCRSLDSSTRTTLDNHIILSIWYDHEEVGSETCTGAQSTLLKSCLERIIKETLEKGKGMEETEMIDFSSLMSKSVLISADMAHGVHPNYPEKHDETHRPKIHHGPVIKYNSNARYATSTYTAALIKNISMERSIPIQEFMVRNDSPCGSTIGPIVSSQLGINSIDLGIAQLSMHSIREMAGITDIGYMIDLFEIFYNRSLN